MPAVRPGRRQAIRRSRRAIQWGVLAIALLLISRFAPRIGWRSGPVPDSERVGPCSVRHVVDGDTIDVTCPTFRDRVRLLRINTPERERWGYAPARNALRSLVGDREVYLAFEQPGKPERGNSERLLAYVYADERNANVEMVRLGWSRFWTKYGKGRLAGEFRQAEREARQARRGLWARR
jgi:micrococcal nuclease